MPGIDEKRPFLPVNIAIMTVSDTRTPDTDKSGNILQKCIDEAGHRVIARVIIPDDFDQITAQLKKWIADPKTDVVISTGGTGVTGRDGTPEAVAPLLDKAIEGFGEMFRNLSYQSIGTSTLQSRALAGVANGTYIFCLPGSTGACKDAWTQLISAQLDYRTRPCNLVELMPRLNEK